MKIKIPNRLNAGLFALAFVAGSVAVVSQTVLAAPLTNTYLRTSRMATGQTASVRLVFRTATAGATSVAINFNGADSTTWTGQSGAVNTTQTVSSASCAADSGATALPGSLTAAGSSSTITISGVTALAASTTYCVDLTSTSAVTNPTSAGEYHPTVTAGSDNVTVAVRVITNDQVVVTATVAPTFNFALSANSDTFTSNLSSSSVVSTSGVTATVNTNAKTGWIAWANDSSTGLTSAAAGKTIASRTPGTFATLTNNTEGYVFGVTNISQGSGAGTTTATTPYNATASSGVNNSGSGLDATYRPIASSTGTAATAELTLKARASISSLTPAAADYTDTITLIAAGSF